MKSLGLVLLLALTLGSSAIPSTRDQADASLELYGTFHAMGITVSVADTDDPNRNAVATVEYRKGDDPYRAGFHLSRISNTQFVGSLFWLEPGTSYDVRVAFVDMDEDPLDDVLLHATASTRTEIAVPPANTTLIVSPTGDGTTCSLSSPCTLGEGIDRAQPGDEVVLRGGVYYEGEISLPRSGAPGAPIVIRSYSDEEAVLDGADPTPLHWTEVGAGVYQTTTNVQAINLMVANGVRLYPYDDLASLQDLRWELPGFYAHGESLYVHLAEDVHPDDAAIVVSRYNRGFYVQRDYIYFLNLSFRHYGQDSEARAIYFNNASNNLVQNSVFAINNGGITIRAESHRNVIQDNEFYDTIFAWPWDAVKATGVLERGGVYFGGPSGGRGNVIRRNTFRDYFDGFDICPGELADKTNETDVYDNLIFNLGDDGVQADGWCSNVRLWNNTFHDVLNGISFAPSVVGPVYAVRNLIYRFGAGNTEYRGGSFKFNNGSPEQSGQIYLIHNTVDAVNPEPYALQMNSGSGNGWESIYARNNSWTSVSTVLRNDDIQYPVDLDYDNWWNGNSDRLMRWDGTNYATLAAFTEATGQEAHGLNTEPGFVSPENGQYMLNSTSPLIDAGVLIPGVNDDFSGLAPDIGAFEFARDQSMQVYMPSIVGPYTSPLIAAP